MDATFTYFNYGSYAVGMKKFLSIALVPLLLAGCGSQNEADNSPQEQLSSTTDSTSSVTTYPGAGVSYEVRNRYESDLIPHLEDSRSTVSFDDAVSICKDLSNGLSEDGVIEKDSPVDPEGYRKVIRSVGYYMCSSEGADKLPDPSQ